MKNQSSLPLKKIAAFTILEMVVVMLLTAMVVSIAFKSLEMTLQNFQRQKSNDSALAHFSLLDRLLMADIYRSHKVIKVENGFKCCYADGKLIEYSTFPEGIIRRQLAVVDTFNTANTTGLFFRNKKEIENDKLIDSVSIDYLYKDISITSNYTKDYTADMLLLNDTKIE